MTTIISESKVDLINIINLNINDLRERLTKEFELLLDKRIFKKTGFIYEKHDLKVGKLFDGNSYKLLSYPHADELKMRYKIVKSSNSIYVECEFFINGDKIMKKKEFSIGRLDDNGKLNIIYKDYDPYKTDHDLSYLRQVERSMNDLQRQVENCKNELKDFL